MHYVGQDNATAITKELTSLKVPVSRIFVLWASTPRPSDRPPHYDRLVLTSTGYEETLYDPYCAVCGSSIDDNVLEVSERLRRRSFNRLSEKTSMVERRSHLSQNPASAFECVLNRLPRRRHIWTNVGLVHTDCL